ncbi:MAG TPA: proteasome accessory factor PafA2 family protein [Candidatus Saccharimonadales bacterium]|nr:proteasome accessory factor PafA2 family protein [Candidatus Saccharimonadales bacterium]
MLIDRVVGTEMEYGITVEWEDRDRLQGNAQIDDEEAVLSINHFEIDKLLFNVPDGLYRTAQFLTNGSSSYADHYHPEYATPEIKVTNASEIEAYDGLDELVAAEIAGERIIMHAFEVAKKQGIIRSYSLNNRILDEFGTTTGYHENYLVDRGRLDIKKAEGEQYDAFGLFGLHNATRNIYAGSGGVYRPKGETDLTFTVAQKPVTLQKDFNLATTTEKPLINTRDEPHAAARHFARLHNVCADPSNSAWSKRIKVGTTVMVLDAIENGAKLGGVLEFEQGKLHHIARQVAADPTCKRPVRRANGATIKPVDIQYEILARAHHNAARYTQTKVTKWILAEWERALRLITEDPLLLADRADWPLRYKMHQKYGGYNLGRDVQFDMINPGENGRNTIAVARAKKWKQWMPPEELIQARMVSPPPNTRAWPRGNYIKKSVHNRFAIRVNWGGWSQLAAPKECIVPDPRSTRTETGSVLRLTYN